MGVISVLRIAMMDGWMDGWVGVMPVVRIVMDGWTGVKAVLRIAI